MNHSSYDPQSYFRLFSHGNDEWHMEMRMSVEQNRRINQMTPLMFYSNQLFQRNSEFSTVLRAQWLFQQYVRDQYCKVEYKRMQWVRLMKGGGTAHSAFKIPIPCESDSMCYFTPENELGRKLMEVDVIIWDEIVMAHRYAIEAVDRSLRDLMGNDMPFVGKVVMLCGDFRQIIRLVPGGSRPQIGNECFRSSML